MWQPLLLEMPCARRKFSHWEDVFCEYFGVWWRTKRDECASLRDWMCHFDDFCHHVCQKWDLPVPAPPPELAPDVACEVPCKRPRVQKYRIEDLPAHHELEGIDEDIFSWDTRAKRFVIVCDCQPLVDVVMGRNLPEGSGNTAVFRTICDHVARLFDAGWLPHQSHRDPVVWKNRNHNAKADHIANVTLDVGSSWHE